MVTEKPKKAETDKVEEFIKNGVTVRKTKDGKEYPAWLDVNQNKFPISSKDAEKE